VDEGNGSDRTRIVGCTASKRRSRACKGRGSPASFPCLKTRVILSESADGAPDVQPVGNETSNSARRSVADILIVAA
jgi:hypothetical protein